MPMCPEHLQGKEEGYDLDRDELCPEWDDDRHSERQL